jgi:hypothetical protein
MMLGPGMPGFHERTNLRVGPSPKERVPQSPEFLDDQEYAFRNALQTGKLHAVHDLWAKWAPSRVWPATEKNAWTALCQAIIRTPRMTAAEQGQALAWLIANKVKVLPKARAAVVARVAAEVVADIEPEAVTLRQAA